MVDENANEVKTLESASDSVYSLGVLMMFVQFLLTLVLSTSLSFFWALINSQINFVYIPLMKVNAPGQVSFYLEVLIFVCTFDPLPMDIIYELVPIFEFDRVNMETDRSVFPRIGLEDRNIIYVLGSLFVFLSFFFFQQIIY